MNNLKIPSDNTPSFIIGFIALTILIGIILFKVDGLIEAVISLLFNN